VTEASVAKEAMAAGRETAATCPVSSMEAAESCQHNIHTLTRCYKICGGIGVGGAGQLGLGLRMRLTEEAKVALAGPEVAEEAYVAAGSAAEV
jgi:hypothetical protein